MCRFHFYRTMLADKSLDEQENIINILRNYSEEASLSRLQTVRETLLKLKDQLSREQSPDLNTAIETAMEHLGAV
ncbi:hypothetical protein IH992_27965 [Candidatus Poribacteria bacterium]|nr:hypothetical protein [Candidatus Poribacteria bacterium]